MSQNPSSKTRRQAAQCIWRLHCEREHSCSLVLSRKSAILRRNLRRPTEGVLRATYVEHAECSAAPLEVGGARLSSKSSSWTSGSDLLPESSPSTPAAHVDTWVDGDEVWIRIDSVHGPFWKRLLSDNVQWQPPWERH